MIQSIYEGLRDFSGSIILEYKISVGDIIALLAFAFAIYQFRKQLALAREDRLLHQREEWFLQVIVLPHLEHIDAFYSSLIDDLGVACNGLRTVETELLRPEDFAAHRANAIQDNQTFINKFFDELEPLVRAYDNNLGQGVADLTLELQDIFGDILDNYNDDERVDNRRSVLLHNKQNLLSLLGRAMSLN